MFELWRRIMYYVFLLNLWKLNKLTEEQVDIAVLNKKITSEEGEAIKKTAR